MTEIIKIQKGIPNNWSEKCKNFLDKLSFNDYFLAALDLALV